MIVAELMNQLKNYPPDLEVVVNSYEEGYDPVTDLSEITVEKAEPKDWWIGVYRDVPAGQPMLLLRSRHLRMEGGD